MQLCNKQNLSRGLPAAFLGRPAAASCGDRLIRSSGHQAERQTSLSGLASGSKVDLEGDVELPQSAEVRAVARSGGLQVDQRGLLHAGGELILDLVVRDRDRHLFPTFAGATHTCDPTTTQCRLQSACVGTFQARMSRVSIETEFALRNQKS